jgi:alpha-tubulin suppressor-like RCC1 family protein
MRWMALLIVVHLWSGCLKRDPLYCDESTPCTDPARPYCDLEGQFPAAEGIKRTCIPDPFPDGGSDGDGGGPRRVVKLAVGFENSCAIFNDGGVRCWGSEKAHGYPFDEPIGDNEHPFEAGDLPTGGAVAEIALGKEHACVRYVEGNVRCWGSNAGGQLGYGDDTDRRGAGYTPDLLPDVDLGGRVLQLSAGEDHTCALIEGGDVRCWGYNGYYQLGSNGGNVGDDEIPSSRSPVALGAAAIAVSAGRTHSCAIIDGDAVMCWGTLLGPDTAAPMGYGGANPDEAIGDDETPEQQGTIQVGSPVLQVELGDNDICALVAGGNVRCWGSGDGGLGYGNEEDVGDDELPQYAGNVPIGVEAVELVTTATARCVRTTTGVVRCWGWGGPGELGSANENTIGDNEEAGANGDINVGGAVKDLAESGQSSHICALMEDDTVRCWGTNALGQLGLGNTIDIGDDELPVDVDPVRVLE